MPTLSHWELIVCLIDFWPVEAITSSSPLSLQVQGSGGTPEVHSLQLPHWHLGRRLHHGGSVHPQATLPWGQWNWHDLQNLPSAGDTEEGNHKEQRLWAKASSCVPLPPPGVTLALLITCSSWDLSLRPRAILHCPHSQHGHFAPSVYS